MEIEQFEIEALNEKALEMRSVSYAPYSDFLVGVALLTEDRSVFLGCNIENAAYSASNCAERTAMFKAISEGKRNFLAIAIAGGKKEAKELDYCMPCGVCRQVMAEFCDPDCFQIIVVKSKTEYRTFTLGELFPEGFGPKNLEEK